MNPACSPLQHRKPETPRGPRKPGRCAPVALAVLVTLGLSSVITGCGALLLVGGAGSSAIAFATGELRSDEAHPLRRLNEATQQAIETLGYEAPESTETADRVHWNATTPGGDPVEIRLIAKGPERTQVRIRIGVFGNEGRSRLVLEQIRQSL